MAKLASAVAQQLPQPDTAYASSVVDWIPDHQSQSRLSAYADRTIMRPPRSYEEEVSQCRFFYRYDPISSTVINRMVDMSVTSLYNRRDDCNDLELAFFRGVLKTIKPIIKSAFLEYLITGSAIIDYGLSRKMGNTVHPGLGRKRLVFPDPMWIRSMRNIKLKRIPVSNQRHVYIRVTPEERYFIEHGGKRMDGTEDVAAYKALVKQFPDYVKLVKSGVAEIHLENVRPILRKPTPDEDWPQPFLVPALAPLKHKLRLKQVDYSIANRALEAIRHIKVGDKDFPVTDDDGALEDMARQINARGGAQGEMVFNLITNHTVEIDWIFPPLDILMSDEKYQEPNADIFAAMGFSRVLLVGESFRSNSGNSVSTTLGPIAALNEMRNEFLEWVTALYVRLAEINGFKNIPEPRFSPIIAADVVALAASALQAFDRGILSKNSVAQMFSTDFEAESHQRESEIEIDGDDPIKRLEEKVKKPAQAPVAKAPTKSPAKKPATKKASEDE